MTITQTIEIPADHWLETAPLPGGNARTIEEALQLAEEKANDPNRKPISRFFGILSPNTFGDGVAYQRAIRDEWDD